MVNDLQYATYREKESYKNFLFGMHHFVKICLCGCRDLWCLLHDDDYLILEDESGRVKLTGAILASMYVTGMCSNLHFFTFVQ